MVKRSLINFIKYNKAIYNIYYYVGSIIVRFIGIFSRQNKKKIVFSSFGGRKYDDSPRCIYEAILNDHRFDSFEFVWALEQPDIYEIPRAKKVVCDSLSYYRHLMSASVWVTNSTMERGLSFKPKRIFNLNSWHGTPLKKMGQDISKENTSFRCKSKKCHDDIMLAQSEYDVNIFSRVFNVPRENFRITGLPRNDELIERNTKECRDYVRRKLSLPEGKKVILYAPTFREYDKDLNYNCVLNLPINLKKWEVNLSRDFVLLIRAHYEVVNCLNFSDNKFVKNVSTYSNLNELLIVSDILISDYSSVFFDYSIMEKPMLCFAYDYEQYSKERGLYFDIRTKLNGNNTNEDMLIESILNINEKKEIEISRRFKEEFVQKVGSASKQTVDIIWNHFNNLNH